MQKINEWVEATLGDAAIYINGKTFSKRDWSDTGRPIIRIQNLTGTSNKFNRFNKSIENMSLPRKM